MEEAEAPSGANKNNLLMMGEVWEKQMNFLLAGLKGICRQMPGTNINFPREEKLLEKKKKEEDWLIAGDPKMSAVNEKHKSAVSRDLRT